MVDPRLASRGSLSQRPAALGLFRTSAKKSRLCNAHSVAVGDGIRWSLLLSRSVFDRTDFSSRKIRDARSRSSGAKRNEKRIELRFFEWESGGL